MRMHLKNLLKCKKPNTDKWCKRKRTTQKIHMGFYSLSYKDNGKKKCAKNTNQQQCLLIKTKLWAERQIVGLVCRHVSNVSFLDVFHNIPLSDGFFTAGFEELGVLGEVDVDFLLVVMLDVFQVDHHVQGVGQNQQQDEGRDEAHQDGWGQDGGAVARRRKLTNGDVERLDLRWATIKCLF